LYTTPSDHPSPVYTRSEVTDILKRVRDSPAVTSERYSGTSSFQGNLNRARGGWKNDFVPNIGSNRNFNHGLSGSFHGTGTYREDLEESGNQWVLETRSALGGVEIEDRVSAIDHEGTGTAQDPFVID